jgi:hypothetical protein
VKGKSHTVASSNIAMATLGVGSSERINWKRKGVVTCALTILTSSQAILIVWSKRAGKYEYSVTTANFLVETLKCALSLLALTRIWKNEGVTDDNRLSTTFDEVKVFPIPAALYLFKNLLQVGCPEFVIFFCGFGRFFLTYVFHVNMSLTTCCVTFYVAVLYFCICRRPRLSDIEELEHHKYRCLVQNYTEEKVGFFNHPNGFNSFQ